MGEQVRAFVPDPLPPANPPLAPCVDRWVSCTPVRWPLFPALP